MTVPVESGPRIERRVLSIDSAYDEDTVEIQRMRDSLYAGLGGRVVRFGRTLTERSTVLAALRAAAEEGRPYAAILVTSHGEPSRVLDTNSPKGLLLADDFPADELRLWAENRALHFMCCDTGAGPLFSRLAGLGARLVVGFEGKPRWHSPEGRQRWREFDAETVRAVVETPDPKVVGEIRTRWLGRVEQWLVTAPPGYAQDLRDMRQTLGTMVIL
ncbi:hypothetical protein [Polyangium jinanense]|uniref:Uncharacterized protein n=1 Tax=Polyangium jinanense TaxID=2829994 RepID=A0A9X4AWV6_9BACT|nr:hypothetical protein [Polyangium jinanense]MDC3956773.1 hypothetical protein [Polyangium jinanense]MDC3987231.1 hypothetical protein [Polyangium jinanense]